MVETTLKQMHSKRHAWETTARDISKGENNADVLVRTFFGILDFAENRRWFGACHAISSVLHVLLKKQGVDSELWLGEVSDSSIFFDHSWVTIQGKIYDVAIVHPDSDSLSWPPTFATRDLETGTHTSLIYGSKSGAGDDPTATWLKGITFKDYMAGFPHHREGLWGYAEIIGRSIGISAKAGKLKKDFSETLWRHL